MLPAAALVARGLVEMGMRRPALQTVGLDGGGNYKVCIDNEPDRKHPGLVLSFVLSVRPRFSDKTVYLARSHGWHRFVELHPKFASYHRWCPGYFNWTDETGPTHAFGWTLWKKSSKEENLALRISFPETQELLL